MTLSYIRQRKGQYIPNNKNSALAMTSSEYNLPTHSKQKLSNEQRPVIRPERGLVQKLKSFKK